MGKMFARIKLNPFVLNRLTKAALIAAEQTAYAIRTDVEDAQVVPFAVGTLQNTSFVDSQEKSKGTFKLVYSTPYARRLYWHPEYNFRTSENANARGEWLEPWINGDKREFARTSYRKLLAIQKRKAGIR